MGEFLDKAKDFAADHDEQVDKGVEKAGDLMDERTGDKYADKVDTAQEKAKDYLGGPEK
jgi:hypothetical protein